MRSKHSCWLFKRRTITPDFSTISCSHLSSKFLFNGLFSSVSAFSSCCLVSPSLLSDFLFCVALLVPKIKLGWRVGVGWGAIHMLGTIILTTSLISVFLFLFFDFLLLLNDFLVSASVFLKNNSSVFPLGSHVFLCLV